MQEAIPPPWKNIEPWWNSSHKEKSEQIWIPPLITETIPSTVSSIKKSWFAMEKKSLSSKNLKKISIKPSLLSPLNNMIPTEVLTENKEFKTIKIRLFPTEIQKIKIQKTCELFKWYYNYSVFIFNELTEPCNSVFALEKEIRQWSIFDHEQKDGNNYILQEHRRTEDNSFPYFDWMKEGYHCRIPRGAIHQLFNGIEAAKSNLKKKNIKQFRMQYKRKKNFKAECLFEDKGYPKWIRKIEGHYKLGKVKYSLEECFETYEVKGGFTLIHDQLKDRYYIHLPVCITTETEKTVIESQDIVSLDPGVRTFQTGYSPYGHTLEIGKDAYLHITKLLKDTDILQSKFEKTKNVKFRRRRLQKFRKIHNLVEDLHWKAISYLTNNYKVILLPDFKISGMVKKGKKIGKNTKRLLSIFSYNTFKQRLLWKAKMKGVNVLIVDESYTSKTCGRCGELNSELGVSKEFICPYCGLKIGRDENGARNIFLKYL